MVAKWILLEPGVDTIQAGDEWYDLTANAWKSYERLIGLELKVGSWPSRRRVVDPVCTREAYGSGGAPSPRECGICGVGPCSKVDTVSSIAESPDDWVTQDRVPARLGIDQECWSNWRHDAWSTVSKGQLCYAKGMKHGDIDHMEDKLSLRCRRKDLPPMPAKTRTVTLREWVCWDKYHENAAIVRWSSGDPSRRCGNLSRFDHAHATGNTRTVEVPCE